MKYFLKILGIGALVVLALKMIAALGLWFTITKIYGVPFWPTGWGVF